MIDGYKTSRYTTVHETDSGLVLFNTLSCGLLKVTDEDAKKLRNPNVEIVPFLASKKEDYCKTLIDNGFLVKNNVDEFALVKSNLNRSKYSETSVGIIINTGVACNCRCTYCYEGQDHDENSILTAEKATDIVAFIKKEFLPTTKLSISFVGGEPLLCFDNIKYILYELKSNFNYLQFSITTNGVLINEDITKYLKEAQVAFVQVSIDGLKHHHDKKRRNLDGSGTYDIIVENVKKLQNADVPVSIRSHIDQEFMNNVNIEEWTEEIKTKFDFYKPINFYITPITTQGKGTKVKDKNFIECMVSIYDTFIKNQIPAKLDSLLMSLGVCFLVSENSYSINSDGEIFKCWHDLDSDS